MSEATSARICDAVLGVIDLLGMKRWRARTAARLQGTILELGAGGGRNASWLEEDTFVIALDPDLELLKLQRSKGRLRGPAVVAVGEALPFQDEVFDGALATLVLCSVNDQLQVAREVKRALRPGGVLHAIDHVASKVPRVRRLQERLGPFWYHMTGSCRIDRKTLEALSAEGFDVTTHADALGSVFVRYEARPLMTDDERV